MSRQSKFLPLIACGCLLVNANAFGGTDEVPEPFRAFDPASKYHIKYDDLDSMPRIGGSFADNSAALLYATHSSSAGDGPDLSVPAPSSVASNQILAKARVAKYVSPELIIYLHDLKLKQDAVNLKSGKVTVEELGEAPEGDEPQAEPQNRDHEDN